MKEKKRSRLGRPWWFSLLIDRCRTSRLLFALYARVSLSVSMMLSGSRGYAAQVPLSVQEEKEREEE